MKFTLKELDDLSGSKVTFYSPYIEEIGMTLFEQFLQENQSDYQLEVDNILERLDAMAWETGARSQFFKGGEGKLGDLVYVLKDLPKRELRLYCIRYGSLLVVLGGGGPKSVRALQEDPKLKSENYLMRDVSDAIYKMMQEGDLAFSKDDMYFEGDLEYDDDNY